MKRYIFAISTVAIIGYAYGQQALVDDMPLTQESTPTLSSSAIPPPEDWAAQPIDWSSTQREFSQPITNNQTGSVEIKHHQVIEVAGGLNYIDADGNWRRSEDVIEVLPDGSAAALRGQSKAHFSPTLSQDGGITITTKSNIVLTTRPLGLYFFDPSTGKEALLANVDPSAVGKLLPPNRIVYPSAFHSAAIEADLRFTVNKSGIECDTIITKRPQVSPEDFSMDPSSAHLQVRHVWTGTKLPQVTPKVAQKGLPDASIDFADIIFAPGRAFFAQAFSGIDTNNPARINACNSQLDSGQIPVGKSWEAGAPSILTESVLWTSAKPQLDLLSNQFNSASTTTLQPITPQGVAITPAAGSETALGSPGFVIDYIIVSGSGDYTFLTYSGNNTYYLSGNVIFNGAVTFQYQSVVKRAISASLILAGSVTCQGSCSTPSILTSVDDNMYGDQITQNCAYIPYGGPALDVWYSMPGTVSIKGMNIRYAQTGISFNGTSCGQSRLLIDSTIESCQTAAYANDCTVTLQNSITASVGTQTSTASCGSFTGSWSSTCNQTSLQSAVMTGMTALANGSRQQQNIFTTDLNGNFLAHNPNCWIYGITGYTALSPSNSAVALPGGANAITLITPRHAIAAAHAAGFTPNSTLFRFIGRSGTHYTRYCSAVNLIANTDIAIVTLQSNLPSDVEFVRVLPANAAAKLTYDISNISWRDHCLSRYFPCIACDQTKQAFAEDIYWWNVGTPQSISLTASDEFPTWQKPTAPTGGDSSSPIFVLLNNELVLVGNWSTQDGWNSSVNNSFYYPTPANNRTGYLGYQLAVGSSPFYITALGRWVIDKIPSVYQHRLAIVNSSGNTEIASAVLQPNSSTGGYNWVGINPVTLAPNTTYYIISQEQSGGDQYVDVGPGNYGAFVYFSGPYWDGATANYPVSSLNTGVPYTFTTYPSAPNGSFGPVGTAGYVWPHSGTASVSGASISAINAIVNPDGYSVSVVDLSAFPNQLRNSP